MKTRHSAVERGSKRGLALLIVLLVGLVGSAVGAGSLLAGANGFPIPIPIRDAISEARRLLDLGKTGEARSIFEHELNTDPKSLEAIRGLALCARDEGDDETALHHFQTLTKLAPKDVAGWRQQALAASRLGNDMEALAAAQTALSLSNQTDRAMSELMTRLLTADMDHLAGQSGRKAPNPWGLDPPHRPNDPSAFDPMSEIPRPEPADPTQGLPGLKRR